MSLSYLPNMTAPHVELLLSSIDSHYQATDGKLVVYLEAGHFNTEYGVDEFCLNSMKDAISVGTLLVKKYNRKIKLVYGILVDDLGLSCSDEYCTVAPAKSLQSGSSLPEELEKLIADNPLLKRDKLMVFSERTSKNRAIDSIKKVMKSENHRLLLSEEGNYEEINVAAPDDGKFLLARRQGATYIAKCPAIISQHYKDVVIKIKQRFLETKGILIIDWSDISDRNKILQGKIALNVMQNFLDEASATVDIINVFFGDDEGNMVRIDDQRG